MLRRSRGAATAALIVLSGCTRAVHGLTRGQGISRRVLARLKTGDRTLKRRGVALSLVALVGLVLLGCEPLEEPAWHEASGYRWRELTVPRRGHAGFAPLSRQ